MTWDERCDHCGRYVDACNLDPCLPPDEDDDAGES